MLAARMQPNRCHVLQGAKLRWHHSVNRFWERCVPCHGTPSHSLTHSFPQSLPHCLTHYPHSLAHSLIHILFQLKTVYYQTMVSSQNCNFDFNIEISKYSEYSSILGASGSPSANITFCFIFNCNVTVNCYSFSLRANLPISFPASLCQVRSFNTQTPQSLSK